MSAGHQVEHPSERLIGRYARGDTEDTGATDAGHGAGAGAGAGGAGLAHDEVWALEAHLESCARCRARLAAATRDTTPAVTALVDGVWAELTPRLPASAPMPRRRRWARPLSAWASPVMVPWLFMTVLVTLIAVILDSLNDLSDLSGQGQGVSFVLLLAPVLPVLGVAASWARGLDPAYELIAGTPRAGLQLVLRRTTSVLVVVISALLVAGWVTGAGVAQWLLPCLAFTTGALALGGLIGVTRAAIGLVAVWAAVIVAPTVAVSRTPAALHADALPVWGAVCALGLAVVIARRGAYTLLGIHR
ncbi:zf-HC2 domain-containing protein [Streptomyces sp. NPDC059896]|uniref:zf-HC2 domain-containing protein n=1 Tax=Streptomyces sp. NPDC059896 TaxID=3346993 RepID=UPI00364E9F1F